MVLRIPVSTDCLWRNLSTKTVTPFFLDPESPPKAQGLGNEKFSNLIFFLSGLHPWHMEVSRLGAESELQLPAYTTATVKPDLSHIFDLHHSSWQHQILNTLNGARDWSCNPHSDTSQVHYCRAKGEHLYFLLFITEKKQALAYSRYLINNCWMNRWIFYQ